MWSKESSKLYKVATFQNSDGEPFGVTIKGRGNTHNKVIKTINRLPRDKAAIFGDKKNTVTEVKTGLILNAKVTLQTKDDQMGQVEIKIHKPSDKRKKATIEIRRLTGHEYDVKEKVQNIITTMIYDYTYVPLLRFNHNMAS